MRYIFVFLLWVFLTGCQQNTSQREVYTQILREAYGSGDYSKWPGPVLDSLAKEGFEDIGVLPSVNYPENNPFSKDKSELGKILFFDPRLSKSGQIACASCHNPELAWTDNSTRSFGHNRATGKRNAMTIMNVAFARELFWDGRAENLEDQVRFPIADQVEMNEKLSIAVEKIAGIEGYKPFFERAFGDNTVNLERIRMAIATFERSTVSLPGKFDRFIKGKKELFTDKEVRGLHLFRTKAGCINCHNTPYFSDNKYHNDGQTLFGTKHEDFGRYHVTGDIADIGKFRTPSLREVHRTGPWMHNGHFPSLRDVLEFYNLGNPSPVQKRYRGTPRDSLIPIVSPMLKKLHLEKSEMEELEAFLKTLGTPVRRTTVSSFPE